MPNLWIADKPLILASKSRSRQALLASAGIPFMAQPAEIDERALEQDLSGSDGAGIARHLAHAKALAVSHRHAGRLVLGADQTLSLGARVFAKPETEDAAAAQLALLSGQSHSLHSAICIARDGEILFEAAPQARLTMRVLTADFIARYIAAAGPVILDSVGAYQLEGLGVHLFERVEGDHSTILGLPLIELLAFLRAYGSLAA